jgi:hypothetical protein
MSSEKKFGLLRNMLRTIGLSQQSADQVVDFIVDLLAGEDKGDGTVVPSAEFPYHLRDNFLSPAELSFYGVLRTAINGRAVLCSKVALADIFYVKKGDDVSRWRIYTNKIDRKHVDFLLCDPLTMRPLVGIELDDSSHQRPDRQARDAFVDSVFAAAGLPLLHIPVKRGYVITEIERQIAPYMGAAATPTSTVAKNTDLSLPVANAQPSDSPRCPKCGGKMVLRTVKSGANAGNQFWGCSQYPNCRTMVALK